jgi:D-glycero-alpha-D-manno-heptose-7-phosphate kinase
MRSKQQLAEQAIHIEQNVIAEHVGSQDQIWAAYGGMNRIDFNRDGSFDVSPIVMDPQRRHQMQDHFMLFFTGISRFASVVAEKKIAALDARERQIRTMTAMVDEAQNILGNEATPLTQIGELLRDAWMLKRELTDAVSTPEVDAIYDAAMGAGALGGKLLGAGGGGFMLFFVEPHKQAAVREALRHLIEVDFNIDMSGSKIVVYEPKGLNHC